MCDEEKDELVRVRYARKEEKMEERERRKEWKEGSRI